MTIPTLAEALLDLVNVVELHGFDKAPASVVYENTWAVAVEGAHLALKHKVDQPTLDHVALLQAKIKHLEWEADEAFEALTPAQYAEFIKRDQMFEARLRRNDRGSSRGRNAGPPP